MPKVTIIVPNYNHASYLNQRIDSILNQTYQDFELILLDDCSADNSREVLNSYKDNSKVTRFIFNDENSGSTFCQWNKGIELAQGEYIWIAESDDWAEKDFLETVMTEIEKNNQIGLVFSGSKLIDSTGRISFSNTIGNTSDTILYNGVQFIKQKLSTSNIIWNASMMVFKKSLYPQKEKSLFINMKYCGDWFFYVLMASQTDVLEIKKTLNNFRIHEQNVSTEAEKTGKSFTEGLVVYNYAKRYLSFKEVLRSSFQWGKSLYKYKQKYQVDSEKLKQLYRKIAKENQLILLNYWGYSLYRLLKK